METNLKLDIVIPSKGRISKLTNCLNSIFHSKNSFPITLALYLDNINEYNYFYSYFKDIDWIKVNVIKNYIVPAFWNSYLWNCNADAICYINDDVLFFPDTLEQLFITYIKHFPDCDGVMGIAQDIPTNVQAAFGVVGIKYADRFPDRQWYPPDYYRFYGDQEIELYAKEIGKFYYATEVKVQHLHGSFYPDLIDNTHQEVRQYLEQDRNTFYERQKRGLLWGESFVRIHSTPVLQHNTIERL